VTDELLRQLPPEQPPPSGTDINALLRFAVEQRPLPLYLRVEDRNSMAHSVEARLPFLDYRLVELAFSLPAGWKFRGQWNKYIVREATRGVIAEGVRARVDKMGFPTPIDTWFRGPWYEPTRDLLGSEAFRTSGVADTERLLADLEAHRTGTAALGRKLFHWTQFAIWLSQMTAETLSAPMADIAMSALASHPPQYGPAAGR